MGTSIEPCIWIDVAHAQEAVTRYVELIPNSRINVTDNFENSGPNEDASVSVYEIELANRRLQILGAGPYQQLNPSISLTFSTSDRGEAERVGNELLDGGFPMMPFGAYPWSEYYGFITDRFGVSWQIMLTPAGDPEIAPQLMFVREQDGRATEAVDQYVSIFPASEVSQRVEFPADDSPDAAKTQLIGFRLAGEPFSAIDGGPGHQFTFNDMVSLAVMCDGQPEVDKYWDALLAGGGKPSQCGWLQDRFGVSWQVVPRRLNELLRSDDSTKAAAVMKCMLQQVKIDVAELEEAYRNA